MEYLVMLVLGLLGFGVFQMKQKEKAQQDVKLGETRGQDKELKEQQNLVTEAITDLDNGIAKMNEERAKQLAAEKNMTPEQRKDAWKKRLE